MVHAVAVPVVAPGMYLSCVEDVVASAADDEVLFLLLEDHEGDNHACQQEALQNSCPGEASTAAAALRYSFVRGHAIGLHICLVACAHQSLGRSKPHDFSHPQCLTAARRTTVEQRSQTQCYLAYSLQVRSEESIRQGRHGQLPQRPP